MTDFILRAGPAHVLDDDEAPLPGHYEVEVWTREGEPVRRFVTDKGRAALLRLIDKGRAEISEDEVDELTTAPNLASLLERMGSEAGDGA